MRFATNAALVLTLSLALGACVHGPDIDAGRAADANATLGISYLRKGELDVALDKLQRALSYDEDNARAHWGLALVYAQLDEPGPAGKHYRQALETSSNPLILNSYGAFLCGQGQMEAAIGYFKRALASPRYTHPEYALTNAGICLRRAGQNERAADWLTRALRQSPEYAPALAAMARLRYADAKHFNARAFFQRLDAVGRLKDTILLLAARNELALGDRTQAYQYMQRYNQSHPGSRWTLKNLNPND